MVIGNVVAKAPLLLLSENVMSKPRFVKPDWGNWFGLIYLTNDAKSAA
jgi:hypothetical protein